MSRNGSFIGAISSQRGGGDGGSSERNITSVQNPSNFSVENGTLFGSLDLPSTVIATLDDATSVSLNVTWAAGSYNGSVAGPYQLVGTLTLVTGVTNATNIQALVTVTVNAAVVTFDYYVSLSGSDSNNGTSPGTPKRTILAALALANAAASSSSPKNISIGSGTFVETTRLQVSPYVSMTGAGKDVTFIKGNSSMNFTYTNYAWSPDRYVIRVQSGNINTPGGSGGVNGNQTLRDFTVDGDARAKHGGVHVANRHNVTLRNVKVTNMYFCGIFNLGSNNFKMIGCHTLNCSYVASDFSSGAVSVSTCYDMEMDNCIVDEGRGYGLKAMGPMTPNHYPTIVRMKVHHCLFTVTPTAQWGGGSAPNISFEIHNSNIANMELYNNTFSSTVSIVPTSFQNSGSMPSTNGQPGMTAAQGYQRMIAIHHNVFDMYLRSGGNSYPLECTGHEAHVYDNYFDGGANAVWASWNRSESTLGPHNNWRFYNNVCRRMGAFYPTGIVKSRYRGITNLFFCNNTIHIASNSPVFIIQVERGDGTTPVTTTSTNFTVRNNLILDESTADAPSGQGGANQFIAMQGNTLTNATVSHNFIIGMNPGSYASGNTTSGTGLIQRAGNIPDPYYRPNSGSATRFAGINVGLPFQGSAPTVGAYELTAAVTIRNITSVASQTGISTTTGTAFNALPLPSTVNVTLDDASTMPLSVTWAQGSYNNAVPGPYTLTGTLTLVTNITNTLNLTASIVVTVVGASYFLDDSFNRTVLGPDYSLTGGSVATLDNSDMIYTLSSDIGSYGNRIAYSTWDAEIGDFEATAIFEATEVDVNSNGFGLGLQNTVNPDPNKGVFIFFNTSTVANTGQVTLQSGNGSTAANDFGIRRTAANTITPVAGREYTLKLKRDLSGSDAIWTGTVTDNTTLATTNAVWTEVGALSLQYAATSKITLYNPGGSKKVKSLRIEVLDNISPPAPLYYLDDTFDRSAIGSNYTLDTNGGNFTVTLNGVDMSFDGLDGAGNQRINYNTWATANDEWEMTWDYKLVEHSSTSYGIGFGIRNAVNPNPNKAVLMYFGTHTFGAPEEGAVIIRQGNGSTTDSTYDNRATSATRHTLVLNREYEMKLKREIIGADALYTASARDTVTSTIVSTTWLETNHAANSTLYYSTSKPCIWHFGGLQQVNRWRIQLINSEAPTNTVLPIISGVAKVGQVLAVNNGTWSGTGLTYSYQWKRGATNIGTNSNTYNLLTADAFSTITCQVTATSSTGATTVTTAATAAVKWYMIEDTFTNPSLSEWIEVDSGNLSTFTVNNPTLSASGTGGFNISHRIHYGQFLGANVHSWEYKVDFSIVGAGPTDYGWAIGVINETPSQPNRHLMGLLEMQSGNAGKIGLYYGNGSTSDENANTNQGLSAVAAPVAAGARFIYTLTRTYSGSGDAGYTATLYNTATPGTVATISWTEVGAASQTYYDRTKPFIANIGGAATFHSVTFEVTSGTAPQTDRFDYDFDFDLA